jgi:hypothetical protein
VVVVLEAALRRPEAPRRRILVRPEVRVQVGPVVAQVVRLALVPLAYLAAVVAAALVQ